jgi:hypothetical protein
MAGKLENSVYPAFIRFLRFRAREARWRGATALATLVVSSHSGRVAWTRCFIWKIISLKPVGRDYGHWGLATRPGAWPI